MRRIISLITALVLCVGLAGQVMAAEPFVPSIGYKDGPEIVEADPHGGCLIVTTIPQAKDKTTDIYQEDRDLLLEVYEKVSDGTMKLPIEDSYVIRDLVDLSWMKTDCVEAGHGHKEWLEEDDTHITVTFDLNVKADVDVVVMVYVDGKWVEAKNVKNNGDGTVTVEFEDICPVAFCVNRADIDGPPQTGDTAGQSVMLFAAMMVISAAAFVTMLVFRNRKHS